MIAESQMLIVLVMFYFCSVNFLVVYCRPVKHSSIDVVMVHVIDHVMGHIIGHAA